MLENLTEIITISVSAVSVLTSIAISVINIIKKGKAVKITNALEFLNEVHDLADNFMLQIENSNYKGEEKKNAVIYNVTRQIPNADVEELAKYIDMKIAFTKEINVK